MRRDLTLEQTNIEWWVGLSWVTKPGPMAMSCVAYICTPDNANSDDLNVFCFLVMSYTCCVSTTEMCGSLNFESASVRILI